MSQRLSQHHKQQGDAKMGNANSAMLVNIVQGSNCTFSSPSRATPTQQKRIPQTTFLVTR